MRYPLCVARFLLIGELLSNRAALLAAGWLHPSPPGRTSCLFSCATPALSQGQVLLYLDPVHKKFRILPQSRTRSLLGSDFEMIAE